MKKLLSGLLGLLPLIGSAGYSQTTSMTSSGLNTRVAVGSIDPAGRQNYDITGGTRPGNGTNLFHSFGDFSLGTNNVARFLNDSGFATSNILSRVTGGHVSNIFGEINTANFPGANLYLINPAGVVFGPTASLNVSGSVYVSTADYLRLADGLRLNALPGPQDAILSQAPVVAFGFLNPHPRPIAVQGATLEVQKHTPNEPARALTFVGGDITISGGALKAEAGIELVSVASRGEVRAAHLGPAGEDLREPLPIGISLGTIKMTNALLETTEPSTNIRQSGPIVIRGGQLVMDHSTMRATVGNFGVAEFLNGHITVQMTDSIRANDSQIVSNGGGLSPHGDVTLEAGKTIQLTNSRVESDAALGDPGSNRGIVTLNAPLVNLDAAHVSATGHTVCCAASGAGSIAIQADRFNMNNGSELNVTGFAPTSSTPVGTIIINATDTVRIDQSQIAANGVPLSSAGNISISAGEIVSITNRSALAANGNNAGNIVIDSGKTVLIQEQSILRAESSSGGAPSGVVHGGNILIQTPGQIRIDEGLVTTRAGGSAGGGNISLQSCDSVQLVHGTELTADHVGIGSAGIIDIRAGADAVVEGGRITADASRGQAGQVSLAAEGSLRLGNGTLVSANNTGTGAAGQVVLHAGDSAILDAIRVSTDSHVGPAGQIRVSAGDAVRIRNGTLLTASDTTGITGNAGRIVLDAGGKVVVDASQILAEPIAGQPGQIQIGAGDAVRVTNGSRLSVNNNGVGNAGTLTIQAGSSVVGENSTFVAQTGEGHGGSIQITAPDQVRLTNSIVSSGVGGSPASVGGTIAITADTVRVENGRIVSNASNGSGGSITIKTNDFRPDEASVVEALSLGGGGTGGSVNIQPWP
ncbi:MAG: filamentous hemagglutinin N-terminal domain-containing protein [Nitrospira sp.]